jgi:hypothetical protein
MAMRNEESLHFAEIVRQIRDIWYDQVNAGHVLGRKAEAAVNDYDAVPILKSGDVHPYLFQSAERDDLQFFLF